MTSIANVPVDEEGNPKTLITVGEKNTINIGNYSNVVIEASISKFVKEGNDRENLDKVYSEVTDFLDSERDKVLGEIGAK